MRSNMAAASRSASMRGPTADEVVISVTDLGKGIPREGSGQHLREILPARQARRPHARHRPRPCHRQGFRRGDGRHDQGRKPGRQQARHAHHLALSGRFRRQYGHGGRMSRERILVVDDEPQIQRFLRPRWRPPATRSSRPRTAPKRLKAAATAAPALDHSRPRPAGHGRQGGYRAAARLVAGARSSFCRPATRKPRRSRRSISAPTTMSKSPSASAN